MIMERRFHIKDSQELIHYLVSLGRKAVFDFDYPLKTNCEFVYILSNGEVIFLPNTLQGPGFLFDDEKCFDRVIEADQFPIDESPKSLYLTEKYRIITINKQIDFYRDHLNALLKFDFREGNREAAQAYLNKVIGRTIKNLTTHTDLVGGL